MPSSNRVRNENVVKRNKANPVVLVVVSIQEIYLLVFLLINYCFEHEVRWTSG